MTDKFSLGTRLLILGGLALVSWGIAGGAGVLVWLAL